MPRYYRKVIKITALDSPNVQHGLNQQAAGLEPTNEIIFPGVLTWGDYQKRLLTWDEMRKCVGLFGEFYEGAEILLYPPTWLNRAGQIAEQLRGRARRAKAIGIDPAEGGDKTAMAAVDEYGLIELVSKKTPDTSIITSEALAFMRRHNVQPERVAFDRGGGGKEHADRLRSQGYPVRTVAFGESLTLDPKRGLTRIETRMDNKEERYAYVNRRAEMCGDLRELLDPSQSERGFALPVEYAELRRQLGLMPLLYDPEGRMRMLPKNRRSESGKEKTLTELLGCSPDESDALVLAVHAMTHQVKRTAAGVV